MNRDGATQTSDEILADASGVSVFLIWTEMVQLIPPHLIFSIVISFQCSWYEPRWCNCRYNVGITALYRFQCSWYEPRWCNQNYHHHRLQTAICFSVLDMNRDGATRKGWYITRFTKMFQCSWYEPRWCNTMMRLLFYQKNQFQCSWYEPRWCNILDNTLAVVFSTVSVFLIWTEMVQLSHHPPAVIAISCFSVLDMNRDGATQ